MRRESLLILIFIEQMKKRGSCTLKKVQGRSVECLMTVFCRPDPPLSEQDSRSIDWNRRALQLTVTMRLSRVCLLFVAFLWVPLQANADVAVLLEEPYSYDGALGGMGHAAIYLNRVCAASHTSLRHCGDGEHGVVISRYNGIAGYDWIAIPLVPYLYAVTTPDNIPVYADSEIVAFLKDQYRRENMEDLAPDDPAGQAPRGNWVQLVGSAYNRTTFAYEIETTVQQDDALIGWLNSRPNRSLYRVLSRNCADFVREIVNFYYPKAVSRGIVADLGVTTPKRTAKSLVKYSQRHPDLEFVGLVIPQVPGTIRRSKPVRGIVESVFKAKKYVVPLAVFEPYVAGGFALAYIVDGRFNPQKKAMMFDLDGTFEPPLTVDQRYAYRKQLDELSRTFPEDKSRHQDASWLEFRAKAQLSADESGHLVLQGPFGNGSVGIGISRDSFLNGDAPFELRREFLITRLRFVLEDGSVPKISGGVVREDWQLLERVLSIQKEQEGPGGQADSREQSSRQSSE